MIELVQKCFRHLDARARLWVAGLMCLTLVGTSFEIVGIGLIVPFIQMVSDPGVIISSGWISAIPDGAWPRIP